MNELAVLSATIKTTLRDIGRQAAALATGLQNAAPGDKTGTPNNTVQYLTATADHLQKIAEECDKLINV